MKECSICADENAGAPLTEVDLQKGCYARKEYLCDHCISKVRDFIQLLESYAIRGRCTMMRDQREADVLPGAPS